jgi:peptidyl-prolyl cis-trans isomerase C
VEKQRLLPSGWVSGCFATLFLLAACSDQDELARVGSSKLRKVDLQIYSASRASSAQWNSQQHLNALIDRTLLAEGARQIGLENDPQIEARIRAAKREILAQAYLEKELRASTDEVFLRQEYEKQKDSLKRQQIQVAQIVVRVAEGRDARHLAQVKANQIYAQLVSGADFAEVAKAESNDPVSAARGGDLGVLKEGEVDSGFFAAAAAIKKDQISKPFETSFGFHIVKAMEDPAMVKPPFDATRGKLAAQARLQAEARVLEKLRAGVKVKTFQE